MKTTLKITLALILTASVFTSLAQSTNKADSLKSKPAIDSSLLKEPVDFPPLQDLIDSAIKHNALVKFNQLEVVAKESNITAQKNFLLKNFGLQADTRYGTFDNFSSSANGQSTTLQSVTSKQFNYGMGVFVKVPLYDLINRKTQLKQAKTELEQAKSMAEAQQNELRQLIIRLYQDVLLKQKILNIRAINMGSATVNMEMIEKEFRNGVIPIADYVRVSDMTSKVQTDYETAKSEFLVAKKILEEIAGFSFRNPELKDNK